MFTFHPQLPLHRCVCRNMCHTSSDHQHHVMYVPCIASFGEAVIWKISKMEWTPIKASSSTSGLQGVVYLQDGIPRPEYVVDNHGEHPRTLGPSISYCFANCHNPHPRFSRRAALPIESSTMDAFMVIVVWSCPSDQLPGLEKEELFMYHVSISNYCRKGKKNNTYSTSDRPMSTGMTTKALLGGARERIHLDVQPMDQNNPEIIETSAAS